jgi:Putative phage tail protein
MGLPAGNQSSLQPQTFGLHRLLKSSYGVVIPIIYGTNRIAPTVIWVGDPEVVPASSGKGLGSSGGKGSGDGTTYTLSVQFALCEGPIQSVNRGWLSANGDSGGAQLIRPSHIADDWTVRVGNPAQDPWGYLVSNHPNQAYSYSQTALIMKANWMLGSSTALPQVTFEVSALLNLEYSGIAGNYRFFNDALPAEILQDFLTNASYGCNIDPSLLGYVYTQGTGFFFDIFQDLSVWTQAAGICISPIFDRQENASKWIQDILDICQSDCIMTNEQIFFLPYADIPVTGISNDIFFPTVTYIPGFITVPPRALGPDDFLDQDPPVTVARQIPQDLYNKVTVEYVNRGNKYNKDTAIAYNNNSIMLSQLRPAPNQSYEFAICRPFVAQQVAYFRLQKLNLTPNKYTFTLKAKHADLDPFDYVTLTEPSIGLNNYLVRITRTEEQEDYSIMCEAQDIWPAVQRKAVGMPGDTGVSLPFDGTDAPQSVN